MRQRLTANFDQKIFYLTCLSSFCQSLRFQVSLGAAGLPPVGAGFDRGEACRCRTGRWRQETLQPVFLRAGEIFHVVSALRNHSHYRDIARDRLGAGTRSTPAACRRDRRARRSCRSSMGSRHASAAIGCGAGFPACRFGGLSSPPKCPVVPVPWCVLTVLGTDSPRNRQARKPALQGMAPSRAPVVGAAPSARHQAAGGRRRRGRRRGSRLRQ